MVLIKKNSFIFCILFFFTLNLYAEKNVKIDHENKSITISANYTTFMPIIKTLKDAVAVWNEQSGLFTYPIKKDGIAIKYKVFFNLLVNSDFNNTSIAQNEVSVVPKNTKYSRKRYKEINANENAIVSAVGLTDGKFIIITEDYKNNIYVLAHEIGHTLGVSHSTGLMGETLGEKSFSYLYIKEILSKIKEMKPAKKGTIRFCP